MLQFFSYYLTQMEELESQTSNVASILRAMESRMDEMMKQLKRTNDRYEEFRDATENQMAEFMLKMSGEDIY